MRQVVPALALALVPSLAACGPQEDEEALVTSGEAGPGEMPLPSEPVGPSSEQLAQLQSHDCRLVARAYSRALERREFEFAARFWDDPVIDGERLEVLFGNYGAPAVKIAEIREEGAAGSHYCTVTGALTDGSDPSKPLRQGKIVLRRVSDVPGATSENLRWTIRSSTFVEPMERSGKGEPA